MHVLVPSYRDPAGQAEELTPHREGDEFRGVRDDHSVPGAAYQFQMRVVKDSAFRI
jgi:hypothetical protein